ncbi:MAG: serine/threonine-protein kinase [Planctomycetaceae bacterium]
MLSKTFQEQDNPDSPMITAFIAAEEARLSGRADWRDLADKSVEPGLQAQMRRLLDCLELLQSLCPPETDQGCSDNSAITLDQASSVQTPSLSVFEDLNVATDVVTAAGYLVKDRLGRGGFADVFQARHPELPRDVAIKIPRSDILLTVELRRRFLQEARVATQLQHPGIVAIYDLLSGNRPAIVYEYCNAGTLSALLHHEQVLPESTIVPLFVALSKALAHAHQHGVLHRDLKPSNILLHEANGIRESGTFFVGDRQLIPRIADFGLALLEDASREETASGAVLGTLDYMAPEQAGARRADIGTHTDTFSLGVVMYLAATGHRPFEASSRELMLARLMSGDSTPPRRIRSEISRELEAVLTKALQVDPLHRYRHGQELCEDLERIQAGEPVQARRLTPGDHAKLFYRRHPVTSVSFLLLLVAVALFTAQLLQNNRTLAEQNVKLDESNHQLGEALQEVQKQQQVADLHYRQNVELQYATDMRLAQEMLQKGDMGTVQTLLSRYPNPDHGSSEPLYEWQLLHRMAFPEATPIDKLDGAGYQIRLSADGRLMGICGEDATVRIYDTTSWQRLSLIPTEQKEVNGICFTKDGNRVASIGDDGRIKIWDWRAGTCLLQFAAHAGIGFDVVFADDDARLISCGNDPVICVWDAATGDAAAKLEGHEQAVESLSLTADGWQLLSVGSDSNRIIWDVAALKLIRRGPKVGQQRFTAVSTLQTGTRAWMVSGSVEGHNNISSRILIEGIETDRGGMLLTHPHGIQAIACFAENGLLAFGDRAGGITVVRLEPGLSDDSPPVVAETLQRWSGHAGKVYSLCFSPDGRELITTGGDRRVQRWDLSGNSVTRRLSPDDALGVVDDITWALGAYCAERDEAIVIATNGQIVSWHQMPDSVSHSIWPGQIPDIEDGIQMTVNRSGNTVFLARKDGTIEAWQHQPDTLLQLWSIRVPQQTSLIRMLKTSPDDRELAVCYQRDMEALVLLDAASGLIVDNLSSLATDSGFDRSNSPNEDCLAVDYSPNQHFLAYATGNRCVVISRNAKTSVPLSGHTDTVTAIKFIDNATLITSSNDHAVRRWDAGSGQMIELMPGSQKAVRHIGYLSNGNRVISANTLGPVRFWKPGLPFSLVAMPFPETGDGGFLHLGEYLVGFDRNRNLVSCPVNTGPVP